MSKRLPWPVAKVREDGTPAIWLTFTNWLVVKQGIANAYLQERANFGERRARQEARQQFGPDWRTNPDLSRWAMLDAWAPLFSLESAALEMYRAGWNAHGRIHEKTTGSTLSPEQLVALGDKHERRGFEQEVKQIKEALVAAVARTNAVAEPELEVA